jgi:hypothetical protein
VNALWNLAILSSRPLVGLESRRVCVVDRRHDFDSGRPLATADEYSPLSTLIGLRQPLDHAVDGLLEFVEIVCDGSGDDGV